MKVTLNIKKRGLILALCLSATFIYASSFVSIVDGDYTEIQTPLINSAPIGTVMMWTTTVPPSGWIEMNGQPTTAYPELASIIGSNVADFRGEHVRGWDNNRDLDINRSLLSIQLESVKSHKHDTSNSTNNSSVMSIQSINTNGADEVYSYYRYGNGESHSKSEDSDTVKAIPSHLGLAMKENNKIKNKSLMFIIKAI